MNRLYRSWPALLAACVLLMPPTVLAQSDNQPTGSWQFFVKVQVPGEPVIANLVSFHADGTVVSIPAAAPDLNNTFFSVGTGVWRHTTGSLFEAKFYSMMHVPSQAGPVLVAYQRALGILTLAKSGNTLSGTFKVEILDSAGNVLESFNGTVEGARIKLD